MLLHVHEHPPVLGRFLVGSVVAGWLTAFFYGWVEPGGQCEKDGGGRLLWSSWGWKAVSPGFKQ
jgi:hypothetical protein